MRCDGWYSEPYVVQRIAPKAWGCEGAAVREARDEEALRDADVVVREEKSSEVTGPYKGREAGVERKAGEALAM